MVWVGCCFKLRVARALGLKSLITVVSGDFAQWVSIPWILMYMFANLQY